MNAELKEATEAFEKTLKEYRDKAEKEAAEAKEANDKATAETMEQMEVIKSDLKKSHEKIAALETAAARANVGSDVANAFGKELDEELHCFKKKNGLYMSPHGDNIGDELDTKAYRIYKRAFDKSLRMYDGSRRQLDDEERQASKMVGGMVSKAITGGTDAAGALLLPEIEEARLERQLWIVNPIRQFAKIDSTSNQKFSRLFMRGNAGHGWVGETQARAETTTQTFEEIEIDIRELYAKPKVSQNNLDDARYDVAQVIVDEVSRVFGIEEAKAFTNGTAANKQPIGILSATTDTEDDEDQTDERELQTFQTVAGTNATLDIRMLDLYKKLKREYRWNARWFMNRGTLAELLKAKGTDGHYIVQREVRDSIQFRMFGFPVVEIDDMPDIAVNAKPIMFGDMMRAYQIVDRHAMRVLVDPYSDKPHVQYYCTRRVGGEPIDGNSMKMWLVTA